MNSKIHNRILKTFCIINFHHKPHRFRINCKDLIHWWSNVGVQGVLVSKIGFQKHFVSSHFVIKAIDNE